MAKYNGRKIPYTVGDKYTLTFNRMASGGKTFKRGKNGARLYVEKLIPGETAEVVVVYKKKIDVDTRIVNLIQASPDRIEPLCPHFSLCGGCSFQHITYAHQLEWKKNIAFENFIKGGGFSQEELDILFKGIIPAKNQYHYRNKTDLSFQRTCDKLIAGFHVPGQRFDLIDMNNCLLQTKEADNVLCLLNEIGKHSELSVFSPDISDQNQMWKGFLKSIFIRTNYENQILISIITSDDSFPERELSLWRYILVNSLGKSLIGIMQLRQHQEKGQPTVETLNNLYGSDHFKDKVLDLYFHIDTKSFFQVNRDMSACLINKLNEIASHIVNEKGDNLNILDLYCGNGFLGFSLSKIAKTITGIELNNDAIEQGIQNAELNNIRNYSFYQGDAGKILSQLNPVQKFDLAVIDPPRAGLHGKAMKNLLIALPEKIIYISCNTASLARDLAIMRENGYDVKSINLLDMFPQTYHVECIAELERKS